MSAAMKLYIYPTSTKCYLIKDEGKDFADDV
jgi:hypothetical protein